MAESFKLKKISVVIPMYNSSSTIIRCLDSVLSQTYQDTSYEVIVVNDGSKDNSREIVELYIKECNHPNYKIILINQINGGVSKARNIGLQNSSGEFIAMLDSDDVWNQNKLDIQMRYFTNSKFSIEFIGCARNNEVLYLRGKKIDCPYKVSPKDLLLKMFPQTSTAIFRSDVFKKNGGYNPEMSHAEDGELWLRYCSVCNFYYIPDSLVITGDGKPNFGHSGLSADLKKMYQGNIKILDLAREKKIISNLEYFNFKIYYYLKHLRRIIITNLR